MAALEGWQIALLVLASILVTLWVIWRLILLWAPARYQHLVKNNAISVDEFVQQTPSAKSCLKVVLFHYFNCGNKVPSTTALELQADDSDKVPGLKVTKKKEESNTDSNNTSSNKAPLVIGTIRMGFGHHRIAYAASSWGLGADKNRETWFHDFLNIESDEATMIKETDKLYSKGSRLASELGGPVEKFWGSLTKSGDEDSLRITYQMAEHMLPIINGLDKNSVIVATHSLVASAAVAAGFENVINLVIDNHAQWFVVVPGALNLVQGPTNYHDFLKMGMSPKNLQWAGHWCPRDLVENIPSACKRRTARAGSDKAPLRLLIPVGGAGAQRKFVTKLLKALASYVKENKVQLFLNAGDHAHMKTAFEETLGELTLDYDVVKDMAGVRAFREALLVENRALPDMGSEPKKGVTLFAFEDYFTAVATSDILCGVTDVLMCKPAEMAFYPVPKLMIRRVGDHEAYSALRTSELGDGTLEAREIDEAMRYVDLFIDTPELLTSMNQAILNNNKIGIYDGCKNAIRIALEMAAKSKKNV